MGVEEFLKVEYRGERVLSTNQIANSYGCTKYYIRQNFAEAKEYFIEGVHYFYLEGEELRKFKQYVAMLQAKSNGVTNAYPVEKEEKGNFPLTESNVVNQVHTAEKESKSGVQSSYLPCTKRASSLYLWTERGAVRHCKMVGTQKAWDMFDKLEQSYFKSEEREPLKIETPFEVEEVEEVETIKIDNRLLLEILKLISDDGLRDKLIIRIAEKIMGEKLL